MGRTNIVIDEKLVRQARRLTRLKTKREIVDAALERRASVFALDKDFSRIARLTGLALYPLPAP
jgi:Arc/MetJ family transcription regulator